MILRLSLLISVLLFVQSDTAAAQAQDSVFADRMVIFVSPDSLEIAALKQQMGEQDFYVAADDENWYRSLAFDMLDSLGVASRVVDEKRFAFLVDGVIKTYDWSGRSPSWFVVLYDGKREPIVTYSISLPEAIGILKEEEP